MLTKKLIYKDSKGNRKEKILHGSLEFINGLKIIYGGYLEDIRR